MEASTLASSSDHSSSLKPAATTWPSNVAVLGIFMDSEHVGDVAEHIRHVANEQACQLLALWRREVKRFPFCIVGGELNRRKAGVVGGLAADWPEALYLHAYARARFDCLAEGILGGFTSIWGLHLTDERRDAVRSIMATTQVMGHA